MRPPIQIVFTNIGRKENAHTEGVLIYVQAKHLSALDRREGNYKRIPVTKQIVVPKGSTVPDIVWAYVGKEERVRRARLAIAEGSARIREEYLASFRKALAAHEGLSETLEMDDRIPVVPLRRVVQDAEMEPTHGSDEPPDPTSQRAPT